MARDLSDLVAILKPQVVPVMEEAWGELVEHYPDNTPNDFAPHFRSWAELMFERTKETIPADERMEFGILMKAAHNIVLDEFIDRKLGKDV